VLPATTMLQAVPMMTRGARVSKFYQTICNYIAIDLFRKG